MTATRPYKVVSYEPHAAEIIARKSGQRVGYVLRWRAGWSAYLGEFNGIELTYGVEPTPDDRMSRALGDVGKPRTIRFTRYRRDAAEKVWQAAQGQGDECE